MAMIAIILLEYTWEAQGIRSKHRSTKKVYLYFFKNNNPVEGSGQAEYSGTVARIILSFTGA